MKALRYILFLSLSFTGYQSYSQITIQEIKAVYKSKEDGRIISEKEFQSYRGRHITHRLVKGKNGAMDTILISPPKVNLQASKAQRFTRLAGRNMPHFSITDLYGNKIDSKKLTGKTIVMNFWFVACPPCILEIPELNKLVTDYENNDEVVFLAFAKDTPELLGKFLSKTSFDYIILPNANDIAKKINVYAYPSHIVIDKKGRIQYLSVGFENKSIQTLRSMIEKSLHN